MQPHIAEGDVSALHNEDTYLIANTITALQDLPGDNLRLMIKMQTELHRLQLFNRINQLRPVVHPPSRIAKWIVGLHWSFREVPALTDPDQLAIPDLITRIGVNLDIEIMNTAFSNLHLCHSRPSIVGM
ncbi:hypothetical protein D3C78_1159360 [compost metagenome]